MPLMMFIIPFSYMYWSVQVTLKRLKILLNFAKTAHQYSLA